MDEHKNENQHIEKAEEAQTPKIVSNDEVVKHSRYDDVYKTFQPNQIATANRLGNLFTFQSQNGVVLKIKTLESGLFKITYSFDGQFEPEFSYAIDPDFTPKQITPAFADQADYYQIRTSKIVCKIAKSNLAITFEDFNGNIINEDAEGYHARTTILKGITEVSIAKKALPGEAFLGLGDKACDNNLRGQKYENWNTDAFGFHEKSDAMYRTIPFYYGIHEQGVYGIFFDNSYKSHFDFAKSDENITRFWADGGELNYYFITDDTPTEIAKTYMRLTGKPELAPMWGLGFHQCRWSYYPEARVRELAKEFRDRQIPCDAIYLDIDYMDGYRCFTWNYEYFPNPKQLISDLTADGFHTVVMIDPGLRVDPNYWVYQDGLEKDMFCKRPNGRIMQGPVWPPSCAFPDYTNPKVREWWGALYKGLYVDEGISGFWNDMNEPAVFEVNHKTFPDDIRHDYEGQQSDHRKAHNIYGMQMARATYEGLKNLKPHKRPLVITRATYAGGQRFSSAWTGDNVASWDHLKIANIQCQRMSISGFSYIGTDIGGFVNEPTGELMVRWLQLGIFHPLYRVHTMGNKEDGSAAVDDDVKENELLNRIDQEPWSYGEKYTPFAKEAIEARYRLLGYLYTAFRQHTLDGTPILRPLFFDYPAIENPDDAAFMWGNDLLVSPILEEAATNHSVYLPDGKWYRLSTGDSYTGGQELNFPVEIDTIPIFVKPGTVLPLYPVRQHTGEQIKEQIDLRVYFINGKYSSRLFEDNGEGYGYDKEQYSDKIFTVEGNESGLTVSQEIHGIHSVDYEKYQVFVYGLPFGVKQILVDGIAVAFEHQEKDGVAVIRFITAEEFGEIEVL